MPAVNIAGNDTFLEEVYNEMRDYEYDCNLTVRASGGRRTPIYTKEVENYELIVKKYSKKAFDVNAGSYEIGSAGIIGMTVECNE
jgi:hypothetical protein